MITKIAIDETFLRSCITQGFFHKSQNALKHVSVVDGALFGQEVSTRVESQKSDANTSGGYRTLTAQNPNQHLRETVACQICGAQKKTLKRHLRAEHNLSAEDYLKRFPGSNLVSQAYSSLRKTVAQDMGLGTD